jgi:Pectate lyase superfamily protein
MPKSIPTLGSANWGQPLNDHLSQLNDPTNGGINKFDTFSARPTNLTTNDTGKTYLYTQTGNIHQWMGSTWKVLNESHVNVKDFGALGDGAADDKIAFQSAIDFAELNDGGTVFIPAGNYKISGGVIVKPKTNLQGSGCSTTNILHTDDNTLFKAIDLLLFDSVRFSSFSINNFNYGSSINTGANAIGIEFGNTAFATLDHLEIENYTAGVGIKVHNSRQWTEDTLFQHVHIRRCKVGILFARSGTGTESFCATKMIDVVLVVFPDDTGIKLTGGAWLYASSLSIKGNFVSGTTGGVAIWAQAGAITQAFFDVMMEGESNNQVVLKVDAGSRVLGHGRIMGWEIGDGNGNRTDVPRYLEQQVGSEVSVNAYNAMTVAQAAGKMYYLGILPAINDQANFMKYKIEAFGGGWASNNIGEAVFTVASRGGLVVNRTMTYGSSPGSWVRLYQAPNNEFYLVFDATAIPFPHFSVQAWKMDSYGRQEINLLAPFDPVGYTEVTPVFRQISLIDDAGNTYFPQKTYWGGDQTSSVQGGLSLANNPGDAAYIDFVSPNGLVVRGGTTTANTDVMRIYPNGNIAINKFNPGSKFAVAGLPEYADNIAALGAGLTAGDFYRTGDLLKVVH